MSLEYRYSFSTPSKASPDELEEFLRSVEAYANELGFEPTVVLNVPFDTPERREFSRRLSGSCVIEDERLRGEIKVSRAQAWHHHSDSGTVRLIPEYGVVLVATDELGREVCMGFLRFPTELRDGEGQTIMATSFQNRWIFHGSISSPDPRYRLLVNRFAEAGFLESVSDEFV